MSSEVDSSEQPNWEVLTPTLAHQIDRKLSTAIRIGFAVVELVVEGGKLRWIRGPAPSEPARMQ